MTTEDINRMEAQADRVLAEADARLADALLKLGKLEYLR